MQLRLTYPRLGADPVSSCLPREKVAVRTDLRQDVSAEHLSLSAHSQPWSSWDTGDNFLASHGFLATAASGLAMAQAWGKEELWLWSDIPSPSAGWELGPQL